MIISTTVIVKKDDEFQIPGNPWEFIQIYRATRPATASPFARNDGGVIFID
jgi:hypothetical protein